MHVLILYHRDGGIRTRDPLNPIQVRYRAALRPVTANAAREQTEERNPAAPAEPVPQPAQTAVLRCAAMRSRPLIAACSSAYATSATTIGSASV
jgi:hypothetical protein